METINDYLPRRKAEILALIGELKAELRQIAAAEAAGELASRRKAKSAVRGPETIKEQVIAILTDCPNGLEATEILDRLRVRFGRELKRESLSPQLSRLGADGVIERNGKTWILPVVGNALDRYRDSFMTRQGAAVSLPIAVGDGAKENPQELSS